nr:putative RNA-directed DNA polymerase, eukaryota, reverse transcriptase zinc-binding domain protein [Tanacetum cinerariifolium]
SDVTNGFQKWCKWIDVWLQTSLILLLVNGSPTGEFKMSRGIRQGDPLSPFLFLIAAEGINVVVNEAINNGVLKGITVGRDRVVVSHLQYADDTIFFCDWSMINGRNLMWLLKCFQKASGLRTSLSKSKLYGEGVSEVEVEEMAHMLKCHPGKLPFMYLGLPIGVNMNKAGSWRIIMENFKDTLSEWKAKSISFGGTPNVGPVRSWWKWEWVGVPRGGSLGELEELSSVQRDLAPVLGNVDSSRWFLASEGVFSVKHIRELIDEKILQAVTYVEETSWCKFVPRKVNVFIWRIKYGRIPVRSILDHIGIDLDFRLCPCCENAVETIDHIRVRCSLGSAVWCNTLKSVVRSGILNIRRRYFTVQ